MGAEDIRDSAWERIQQKPSVLKLDGDPIEELAKAHERHADELDRIAEELRSLVWGDLLGRTDEGEPAVENIRRAESPVHPEQLCRGGRKFACDCLATQNQ